MKMIKIFSVLLVLLSLTLGSCSKFTDLNKDPNRIDKVTPGALLNPILYNLAVYNWNRSNSFTMELMQVSLPTNSSGGTSRYNFNDNIGSSTWDTYYLWLNNIKEMETLAISSNDPNYQAIALTLRSWVMELLTDSFGDVPMTEAGSGSDGLFQPKFDKQADIYTQLLANLEKANTLFNTAAGLRFNPEGDFLFGATDLLVSGQSAGILKWKKFCNSLHLRIAMRLININNQKAKTDIEAIFANPTTYPVFNSNADAALLNISGVFPQSVPMTRPQD